MKVMVVTPYLPHRRVGHGGGTAVRDLVTWLARKHEVLVASPLRPGEDALVEQVAELGVQVVTLPFRDAGTRGPAKIGLWADRLAAWSRARNTGYPLYVEKYWSAGLSQRLQDIAVSFAPDAIQVEYLQLALLVRDLVSRRGGQDFPRVILNSHELGSVPRQRRAAAATDTGERRTALAEAGSWCRLQVDASKWADRTLCVTDEDRDLYARMGGCKLVTVPLGVDTTRIIPVWDPPPDGPEEYLFVGSFGHRPNRLAARLLVETVWPLVRNRRPGAQLVLAGRGSREFLAGLPADLPQDGVRADGFVDDLTPLFRRSRLFLAPLAEGGGIKIKILEAMARGIPVLTTEVGAEGIFAPADEAAIIASPDGREFAAAVCEAAADPEACRQRAARGRAHIESSYSWESIVSRLADIYREA
ncbi:hypothetical protein DRQ50_04745 [bacterium]|nr:MAG: hypothetical protein DRQ50_04745 [bacterium]